MFARLLFYLHVNSWLIYNRYVFGVTHIPRLEDWPVMPVERIGFMLMVITWLNLCDCINLNVVVQSNEINFDAV